MMVPFGAAASPDPPHKTGLRDRCKDVNAALRGSNLMPFTIYRSPIGPLTLSGDGNALSHVRFPGRSGSPPPGDEQPALFAAAVRQLDEYFGGERRRFELELELGGTEFQRSVWSALREIPFGATTTYGELARRLAAERPGATANARAVGAAVGATPVPIIVPCHRVIGADGSLTGYGGGLHRKRALLEFEAAGGNPARLRSGVADRQLALL
jgi:methylated-DNA-[protein]-cysteine S-methyltransferase